MSQSLGTEWILLLSLTALFLSLVVVAQEVSRYLRAYRAAPSEAQAFLDVVDSSIAENESYDLDVAKAGRLEDKLRLGRLLRCIQKDGDDLREYLSGLMTGDADPRLRTGARILWASKQAEVTEKVRRLDLLRMRFLVVHMGIIAGSTSGAATKAQTAAREAEKSAADQHAVPKAVTESIKAKPPLRRLQTQAIGHHEHVEGRQRVGWAGVIQELQKNPSMRKRFASIEMAMARSAEGDGSSVRDLE